MNNYKLFIILLFFSIPPQHEAKAQISTLKPNDFIENFRPIVPVSGGLRKGFLMYPVSGSIDTNELSVWLPKIANKSLCVSIDSLDGNYIAEANYKLLIKTEGQYRLEFPTKHSSTLNKYSKKDLSVISYIGDSCPGKIEMFLPIQWNITNKKINKFLILINSQGADTRIYYPVNQHYYPCNRLNNHRLKPVG
jgi:hypothetical protein